MNIYERVAESNRIEGIHRPPTNAELAEHNRFTALPELTISDLMKFVGVYQPDALLRGEAGLDVRVGNHVPPKGGPQIVRGLMILIGKINLGEIDAYQTHVEYETLHPFTDGNGRSGRAIWYWMMRDNPLVTLGFLHAFYYQTLQNARVGELPSTENHTRKP